MLTGNKQCLDLARVRNQIQRIEAEQEDQVHHIQALRRLQRDRDRGGERRSWLGSVSREAHKCTEQDEDCMSNSLMFIYVQVSILSSGLVWQNHGIGRLQRWGLIDLWLGQSWQRPKIRSLRLPVRVGFGRRVKVCEGDWYLWAYLTKFYRNKITFIAWSPDDAGIQVYSPPRPGADRKLY